MKKEKPHIVLFMSDQHNAKMMSCADDPHIQTPNLDRLAAEGVRFDNCYCGFPLCVPSRMNFLTGQACHKINVWGNDDSLSSNIPTFAHGLAMAGYRTVLVGRMHFVGDDQHHGFHERRLGDVCSGYPSVNRAEDRFLGYYGVTDSILNAGPGRSVDQEFDMAVAMEACRVIRDHEVSRDERPLCLVVGFYSPHDAYRVYDQYYRLYDGIDDAPVDPDGENLHPFYSKGRDNIVKAGVTCEHTRRARVAYRGKTSYLDEVIGRVLERIEDSGLKDNCMRVYTSDHGEMIGEHGLWTKGNFYESSAKVPLIISWPGHIDSGKKRHQLAGLDDVGPTLLDIVGGKPLPNTECKSLKPLLTGDDVRWDRVVLSELSNAKGVARMVRKGPWKLNFYHNAKNELFNLDADPDELDNLIKDSSLQEIAKELEKHVYEDGWNPERILETQAARAGNYSYLREWAIQFEPQHPIQWGYPAEL